MKRLYTLGIAALVILGMGTVSLAKPRIHKWVQDKQVSSKDVLRRAQYQRVISVPERQALALVQRVMTDDLYMALVQYRTTKHQQDAETTMDSVLPEEVIKQADVDLIDEDYRFVLEVKLKRYGNRTRVTAKASPVYRLRDWEAEDARDEDSESGTSIKVKVKAGQGSAVVLGPMVIAPVFGLPSDYEIAPLPDAADRAGKIVKSFMYLLDRQVKQAKRGVAGRHRLPKKPL